jgi:hypothetical protein
MKFKREHWFAIAFVFAVIIIVMHGKISTQSQETIEIGSIGADMTSMAWA